MLLTCLNSHVGVCTLHILIKHAVVLYQGDTEATVDILHCSLCEAHWEKILGYQYWEYFLPLGN